jgi:hypothetical protein
MTAKLATTATVKNFRCEEKNPDTDLVANRKLHEKSICMFLECGQKIKLMEKLTFQDSHGCGSGIVFQSEKLFLKNLYSTEAVTRVQSSVPGSGGSVNN